MGDEVDDARDKKTLCQLEVISDILAADLHPSP